MQALVLNVTTGHSGGEGRSLGSCDAAGNREWGRLSGGEGFIRYLLLECFRMWSFARNVKWDANTDARNLGVNICVCVCVCVWGGQF